MKNSLIALFALWAVVATCLFLREPPPPPVPEIVAAPAQTAPDREVATSKEVLALESEVAKLRAENTQLGKDLADARSRLAQRAERRAGPTNVAVRSLSEATNLAQNIAAQIQKALSAQLGARGGLFGATPEMMEKKYGPLMTKLALFGARKDEFLKALAASPSLLRLGGLSDDPPENEALKNLLSANEYAAWQGYEQALPYSEEVQRFGDRLADKGTGLTAAQQESLAGIFQRNKLSRANRVEFVPGAGGQASASALDKNYSAWDAVVQESRAILNASQQKELDLYLGERAEEHEKLARMVQVHNLSGLTSSNGAGAVGSIQVMSMDLGGLSVTSRTQTTVIDLGDAARP